MFVYVPRKKSKLSLKGKRKRLKAAAAAAKQLKLKHLDTVQQTCPLPSILNPPVTKPTIVYIDSEEYGSEGSEEDLPPTQDDDDDDDDDAATEDLFSNIPENAYIICIEYTHPDGREQGMDLQIGITGTPKYLEDPVNATKREIKEELGLDASDDYIKSSYFGPRLKRLNTTWHYSTMDVSKLTIPTKRTYKDKKPDWGRNQPGFYKVMVIPWTTDPVHFINKIEESIKIGGMDQLLADDIKKIVLVPKSVVLEWYPQVIKRLDRPNQPKDRTQNSALSKMLARQGGQKKYRGKTKKNLKQRTNRTKKRNKKLNKKKEIE